MNFITSLYPLSTPTTSTPPSALYPHSTPNHNNNNMAIPPNNNLYYGDIAGIPPINSVIDENDVTRVKFSRDDLLKFSSQEYDDYIKKISLKRALTEKEHKESKKQRRLIKNREYAQISRNKKKSEYTQLSVQIEHLNQYNNELIDRVNELEAENKRLKEENLKLQETRSSSSSSSTPDMDSPFEVSSSPPEDLSSSMPGSPPMVQSPLFFGQAPLSPPLTPPSSEDSSSSFDLFSEDYTDHLFSDWSSLATKYTFMAVFCCLVLALPLSAQYSPFPLFRSPMAPIPPASAPLENAAAENPVERVRTYYQPQPVFGFNNRRNLLTTPAPTSGIATQAAPTTAAAVNTEDNPSPINEDNFGGNSSKKLGFEKKILTIEDVLNDELIKAEDKGIGMVSIKEYDTLYTPSPENGTSLATMPMVISNKIHHPYFLEN